MDLVLKFANPPAANDIANFRTTTPGRHQLAGGLQRVGDDAAFVHDTLMVPDYGTSRADFPGGDAAIL